MIPEERRKALRTASLQWAALAGTTAALYLLFSFAHVPAPALIGAIAAAMILGRGLKLQRWTFLGAQAVIGCMIGQNLTGDLLSTFAAQWPLVLSVTTLTVGVSLSFGWGFYKFGLLDKATALWGSLPGAASAMVILSQASGANMGLVAFVQYVRVVSVAVLAALAGGALAGSGTLAGTEAATSLSWQGFALGILIIAGLTYASVRLRIIGLCLIGGMTLSGGLELSGVASVWLPDWLMAFAYFVIGWQVGLSAGPDTLQRAKSLLLPVLASTVFLLALSAVVAVGIDRLFGVGLHTAFLATIPGGLDAVAIVAASTGADVAFVMLFQTVRFLLVVLLGIPLLNVLLRAKGPGSAQGQS